MKLSERLKAEQDDLTGKVPGLLADTQNQALTSRQRKMLGYLGESYSKLADTIQAMRNEMATGSDPELGQE